MNIHHLEFFYYVARHRGISSAVRHMPYGIQQPAVSSQILLLEQDLGGRLFERNPFRLTAEGEKLYACGTPACACCRWRDSIRSKSWPCGGANPRR